MSSSNATPNASTTSTSPYKIDLSNPKTSPQNASNQDLNNNVKNFSAFSRLGIDVEGAAVNNASSSSSSRDPQKQTAAKIGRQFTDPTEADINIITHQLKKRNITPPEKVLFRCKYGYPAVTLAGCAKRKQGTIVPGTLIWLTCPRRTQLVSHLEQTKFLKELEYSYIEKKQNDLNESHENFRKHMKGILDRERYVKWLSANKNQDPSIAEEDIQVKRHGNAGVSAASSVKCMHAHVAGFSAGVDDPVARTGIQATVKGNVTDIEDIGKVLNEAVENGGDDALRHILDCPAKCVHCDMLPTDRRYSKKNKRKRDDAASTATDKQQEANKQPRVDK